MQLQADQERKRKQHMRYLTHSLARLFLIYLFTDFLFITFSYFRFPSYNKQCNGISELNISWTTTAFFRMPLSSSPNMLLFTLNRFVWLKQNSNSKPNEHRTRTCLYDSKHKAQMNSYYFFIFQSLFRKKKTKFPAKQKTILSGLGIFEMKWCTESKNRTLTWIGKAYKRIHFQF